MATVTTIGRMLLLLSLAGCASSPSVGSIGVVLGRDTTTQAVFVREVPDAKGDADPVLLPGDELMMVDGYYVRQLSADELRRRLRGAPGSKVKLTVVRGGQILRVEVARTALKQSPLRPSEERLAE